MLGVIPGDVMRLPLVEATAGERSALRSLLVSQGLLPA